jgi:hypothetical protein
MIRLLILTLLLGPVACAIVSPPPPARFRDSSIYVTTGDPGTALLLLSPRPESTSKGALFGAGVGGATLLTPVPDSGWLYPSAPYTATVHSAARPKPSYAPLNGVTARVGH